ncbi:ABC transporter ATP-binding protein [Kroppenstedtia eburnea]|uniref:ABC-type multidrug transport system, ATPase component n=1 Tax=Kroppenstedtia eburnea TaxID=714067 RepID=A0A1N7NV13_9BACL|nr:ATP-binding cassette domain-containing protein [Kroppenstedtia eburnea]QKI81173.1 ATP-binding cassette domain-containing protein [Kroppenstedtia eburnea]SIT02128.1 ABC-type multidrug transport system, ATPase component [Kroppenstedtia eburnea]
METMLEVKGLSKKVRGRTLLNEVGFTVQSGEICGLLGPNGAGKTTLIRVMTGLIRPTAGSIRVAGVEVHRERSRALGKMGAIVENPIFFPYMSGRDNLTNLALLDPGLPKKKISSRVEEVLKVVDLAGRADDKVGTYSLGMKQRLGIAQALLGEPEMIILDEPANGLDPIGMRQLRELILKLNREAGITFLVSSHLLDEIQRICNRLVVIKDGAVIWQGETADLSGSDGDLEEAFVELVSG